MHPNAIRWLRNRKEQSSTKRDCPLPVQSQVWACLPGLGGKPSHWRNERNICRVYEDSAGTTAIGTVCFTGDNLSIHPDCCPGHGFRDPRQLPYRETPFKLKATLMCNGYGPRWPSRRRSPVSSEIASSRMVSHAQIQEMQAPFSIVCPEGRAIQLNGTSDSPRASKMHSCRLLLVSPGCTHTFHAPAGCYPRVVFPTLYHIYRVGGKLGIAIFTMKTSRLGQSSRPATSFQTPASPRTSPPRGLYS